MYREILRTTAKIRDEGTKNEMREFARAEFVKHREVTDLVGKVLFFAVGEMTDCDIGPYPVPDLSKQLLQTFRAVMLTRE